MGFDENVEMVRLAFYQVLISSGPFLGAALAIGLIRPSRSLLAHPVDMVHRLLLLK